MGDKSAFLALKGFKKSMPNKIFCKRLKRQIQLSLNIVSKVQNRGQFGRFNVTRESFQKISFLSINEKDFCLKLDTVEHIRRHHIGSICPFCLTTFTEFTIFYRN